MDKDNSLQDTSNSIGLKELISQIKQDLINHEGPELFYVKQVDVEISFTVEFDGRGGIRFAVVDVGGGGKRAKVHTVRLTMEPLMTLEETRSELAKRSYKEEWPITANNFFTDLQLPLPATVKPPTLGARIIQAKAPLSRPLPATQARRPSIRARWAKNAELTTGEGVQVKTNSEPSARRTVRAKSSSMKTH